MTGTQWRFVNIGGPEETKNEELRRMVRVNAARVHWRRQAKIRSNGQPTGELGHQSRNSKAQTSVLEFTERDHDQMAGRELERTLSGYDLDDISDGLEIVKLAVFASKGLSLLRDQETTMKVPSQEVIIGDQHDLRRSLQAGIIPNPVTLGSGEIDPSTAFPTDQSSRHNSCLLNRCKSPLP